MIHLTLQQLSAFLDCELTEASTELIRRHLSECDACTLRFGRLEAQEEVLARILVEEPGHEFFAELSESIAARCAGGKPTRRAAATPLRTPAPEPTPTPMPMPLRTPAPTSSPEPASPAAGPAPRPILHGRRESDRVMASDAATRARNARIAAVVICVIVASAAWVGLHREKESPRVAPPAGSPPPSATVESTMPEAPSPAAIAPSDIPPSPAPTVESAMTAGEDATPEPAPHVALERVPDVAPVKAPDVVTEKAPETAPETMPPTAPEAPPEKAREIAAKPRAKARAASGSEGALRITVPGRAAPVTQPKPPAPQPERLVDRAPRNLVPVTTIITETILTPTDRDTVHAPAPAPRRAQAAPPPPRLLEEAKSASLRAAKTKDPAAFDDAAAAWERALPLLGDSPEDLAMARREIAQARFQAWAESPSAARREAAVIAARGYLLYAPPGPERDQAWTWLGRLKH